MFYKFLLTIVGSIVIYLFYFSLLNWNASCENGRYQAIIKTNHYSTSKQESVVVYDTRSGNIYRYN